MPRARILGIAVVACVACSRKSEPVLEATPSRAIANEAAAPRAPEVFEGELRLRVSAPARGGEPLALTLKVRRDQARIDFPPELVAEVGESGAAYLVYVASAGRASLVSGDGKESRTFDLRTPPAALERLGGGSPDASTAMQVKRTGARDRVADLPCEEWEVAEPRGVRTTRLCVADRESPWLALPPSPRLPPWIALLLDGKHLPLRLVALDRGVETARVEVTGVLATPQADAVFVVPTVAVKAR